MSKKISLCNDGVFSTLQGEAPFIGVPAVFVRLTSCNLRCSWCDTPYTVFPERLEKVVRQVDDVALEIVAALDKNAASLVVITGGEPLLQRTSLAEMIEKILESRQGEETLFQFETNGTQAPLFSELSDPRYAPEICYVVSPKTGTLGNEDRNTAIHEDFHTGEFWTFFKVVYDNEEKLELVAEILDRGHPRNSVALMPEGQYFSEEKYSKAADKAIELGVCFSPRLHTILWGTKRGV